MPPVPMSKDICCQNFKGLLAHVRKHYGEEGIRTLTSGLLDGRYFIQDKFTPSRVIPIQEEHLTDPAYWVSNDFSLALLGNVNKVVKGPDALFTAGKEMVKENLSKTSLLFAKFVGLRVLAGRAANINRRFNRTKDVNLVRFQEGLAVFELNYKSGFHVTKDVCNWNLGIYTGITELSGASRIAGRETDCILEGGRCCRFEITWDNKNTLSSIPRVFFHWAGRWIVKDLIADYEKLLDERDKLIDNLGKSEKKYRALFEDSQEALSLTHNGRIIDVNPAWMRLHGYTEKSEAVGNDILKTVHPEDRTTFTRRYENRAENEERMFQMREITRSGQVLDVEVYLSRIEFDGKESVLTMVKDVTRQKQAEEHRRQLEAKLQRAEKMETIATMAGGVAHDLNNILSGIVGYPEIIIMRLPEDSPLIKPLTIMHTTAKKAAAIVQDLLTLSRRGLMNSDVFNLNHTIREYIESPECQKLLSYHPDVRIEADLTEDLWNTKGSPVHIYKTIMNLVSNAAEAMPEGGSVRIKTGNCRIDPASRESEEVQEGNYCLVSVTDTGVGIAEENRYRIFEPFYTKKKLGRSGTGLGMAVVWGTVKDHGGHIHVESQLGKGSEIKMYLPATAERPPVNKAKEGLRHLRGHGEKILVVDDMIEQREIATDILACLGYRAVAVASGEEAIRYLETNVCDLIILDMIMEPGIDGLETYRRIVEKRPGQKAIIASGYSETETIKEAQSLGAGRFVKKPYTMETIGLEIRRELERK
ncbi:MAG: PAS domain S-box protein [Thermodesulfobacteriota bacterium]